MRTDNDHIPPDYWSETMAWHNRIHVPAWLDEALLDIARVLKGAEGREETRESAFSYCSSRRAASTTAASRVQNLG